MSDILKEDETPQPACDYCEDSGFIVESEMDEEGNIRWNTDVRECPHCKKAKEIEE